MKPLLSRADAAATLSRRGYDPLGKWLPGSKGGWRVQAVTPEGSIAWVEVTPGGPGGHPRVTKRNPMHIRRNHHIRVGGTFYTPGGRKGTVLGPPVHGSYPVRWKDGTLGRVRDTEKDAYPTEGSRTMKRKRRNPYDEYGNRTRLPLSEAERRQLQKEMQAFGEAQERRKYTMHEHSKPPKMNPSSASFYYNAKWRRYYPMVWDEEDRRMAIPADVDTDTRAGGFATRDAALADARKRLGGKMNPIRIDTPSDDRRTGKRAVAQAALRRIQKANDLGFFLDHRGWYRQDRTSHFIESDAGRRDMSRAAPHRKYLSPSEAAHLNAFVAGKGWL